MATAITGSASMLAESAPPWADAGNRIFLFVSEQRTAVIAPRVTF
ncbi:hypothetical protein [Salinibacterium xinjiangense]|nr:hypothetical protein [Salinibacterium xinjiangense]